MIFNRFVRVGLCGLLRCRRRRRRIVRALVCFAFIARIYKCLHCKYTHIYHFIYLFYVYIFCVYNDTLAVRITSILEYMHMKRIQNYLYIRKSGQMEHTARVNLCSA